MDPTVDLRLPGPQPGRTELLPAAVPPRFAHSSPTAPAPTAPGLFKTVNRVAHHRADPAEGMGPVDPIYLLFAQGEPAGAWMGWVGAP